MKTQIEKKPWPFSVGFPLSIRQQSDSVAVCGANHGAGWSILCEVPKSGHAERDARSIAAACEAHVDLHLRETSVSALLSQNGKLREALTSLVERDLRYEGQTVVIEALTSGQARELIASARAALSPLKP